EVIELDDEITLETYSDDDSSNHEDEVDDPRVTHHWSYRSRKNFHSSRDKGEIKNKKVIKQYEPKLPGIASSVENVLEISSASAYDIRVDIPPRTRIRDAYISSSFTKPPIYFCTEEECLDKLLNNEDDNISDDSYLRFDLNDFIIYDNTDEIIDPWNRGRQQQIFWDGFIIEGEENMM
ncbi:11929_t:CDS:1, partial [Acaulospora morrowiae]